MHQSSFEKMKWFRDNYLEKRKGENLLILDLGSMDINGSYRPHFDVPTWTYKGIDLAPGANVDIVLTDPHTWRQVASNSADVVISGQAFEHINYFWITILEISRVLKPSGLCCLIAPSGGYEHRYPVDCWRFFPDGFSALARFARMDVLDVSMQTEPDPRYDRDDSNLWKDTMLVCVKPRLSRKMTLKRNLRRAILHKTMILFA